MSLDIDARRLGQAERHDSLSARNTRLAVGDMISVRLRRFDPAAGGAAFQDFQVPYRKWMRVLDALNWIAENAATDLAYTAAGGTANYLRSPLQRSLRDIHALTQHIATSPQQWERGGRLLLGLDPQFPLMLL